MHSLTTKRNSIHSELPGEGWGGGLSNSAMGLKLHIGSNVKILFHFFVTNISPNICYLSCVQLKTNAKLNIPEIKPVQSQSEQVTNSFLNNKLTETFWYISSNFLKLNTCDKKAHYTLVYITLFNIKYNCYMFCTFSLLSCIIN